MRLARIFGLSLLLFCLSWVLAVPATAAGAAQPPSPVAPAKPDAAPAAAPAKDLAAASFRFAVAKSLAAEGSWAEALAAYDEAESLAPDDPYVRAEHALLLARLAQSPLAAGAGGAERAKALIEQARALAPDDLDLLRTAGQVYLTLSGRSPETLDAAVEVLEAVRAKDPSDLPSLLPLGRIYLDRGDAKKASEVFSDLVKFVPNNRMAAGLLVESLLRSRQTAEAERALADLLAADPESIEARSTLADLQEHRGDVAAARKTLESAPESVRADPQLQRQLASAFYFSGELDRALALVDELLKTPAPKKPAPDAPDADTAEANDYLLRLRGMILAAQGRTPEAIEVLSRLAQESPDDLPVALALARCLDRAGKTREAEKAVLTAADALAKAGKADEAAEARIELASLLADAKAWPRVTEAVQPLLASTDPETRARAILFAVDAAAETRDPAAGLDLLASLTDGAAPSPVLAAKRAELLLRQGHDAEGKAEIDKLEAAGPGGALAAAQVYQRLERYPEGLPILTRLTEAKPDSAPGWFLLGAALERTGDHERAVAAFRHALTLEPDFHSALNYLGYLWADRGENLDEALTLILRAVALDPENGAYVDSLGWVRYRLKEYAQARGLLERAARLMPKDASVQEHLGDLYKTTGEVALAREAYRRALALESENADQVKRKLTELPRR
ncbi:MAG TPA: tetratricopeptide repeat protein [Thermoanaerobaculia bacterium]|jgi:tetratricopeptide (TPR) repeat protein|nr:tetratricopeptide repeat protein [Thermoanaerobaculia bacterium]